MERETGIEPAIFSLGIRRSIENREHSVSRHLVQAMEIVGIALPGCLHGTNGAHTNSNVVLTIQDDGRGINRATLRAKGSQRSADVPIKFVACRNPACEIS